MIWAWPRQMSKSEAFLKSDAPTSPNSAHSVGAIPNTNAPQGLRDLVWQSKLLARTPRRAVCEALADQFQVRPVVVAGGLSPATVNNYSCAGFSGEQPPIKPPPLALQYDLPCGVSRMSVIPFPKMFAPVA